MKPYRISAFLSFVFIFEKGLLLFVIDDGSRVAYAIAVAISNFARNEFGSVEVANFRKPLTNVLAIAIKLLSLAGGVEDA